VSEATFVIFVFRADRASHGIRWVNSFFDRTPWLWARFRYKRTSVVFVLGVVFRVWGFLQVVNISVLGIRHELTYSLYFDNVCSCKHCYKTLSTWCCAFRNPHFCVFSMLPCSDRMESALHENSSKSGLFWILFLSSVWVFCRYFLGHYTHTEYACMLILHCRTACLFFLYFCVGSLLCALRIRKCLEYFLFAWPPI